MLQLMVPVPREPIFFPLPISQQPVRVSSFSLALCLLSDVYFFLSLGAQQSDVKEGGFPDSGEFWE